MSTKNVIIEILADKALLKPDDICMSDSLADLGIDSMSIVEFLFSVEERFNIDFDINLNLKTFNDFEHLTVEKLINSLEGLISKKGLNKN